MTGNVRSIVVTAVSLALLASLIGAPTAQTSAIPTRTFVESSANPAWEGATITVTARVRPLHPEPDAPTGTVDFYDHTALLGTAELTRVDGVASATVAVTLVRGTHPIIARYRGNGTFGASESVPPLPQFVTRR